MPEWPEKIKRVDKRRYLIKLLALSCLPDAIAMRKNEVEIAKLQRFNGEQKKGGTRGESRARLINRAKGSRGRERNGLWGSGFGGMRQRR